MNNSREIEIRNKIDAYIKGKLSEEETQKLWNEFAKNPELLEVLELEVHLKTMIEEEAMGNNNSSIIHRMPKWTWHASAAAIIVVVALFQLFRVNTPTNMNQFVVQNINLAQLETSDGVRDNEIRFAAADSLLNLGFEAVISGDEERALKLFDEVISEHDEEPYASKAFLNKGIILYNEGDYESAIDAFREAAKRVEGSRMILEKTQWYLGNALVNMGELEQGFEAVLKTYQMDGIFRQPAFKLLKKLSHDLDNTDYEELETPKLN